MERVLLIAGHGRNRDGSFDPGASSSFGREADYTRELVTMMKNAVGDAAPVEVFDLEKNCYSYSKAGQGPDYGAYGLVVEIHFNAKEKKDETGDGRFGGIGAYVHPQNSGREVAERMVGAVAAMGFGRWEILSSTSLYNLNRAQEAGTAYLLLETAFLDDRDDMDWYGAHRTQVAQALAQEVVRAAGGTKIPGGDGGQGGMGYSAGMYKVQTDGLNIRKGPGTEYRIQGIITDRGTYTITEVVDGWGRLKSGAGWIALQYAKKV